MVEIETVVRVADMPVAMVASSFAEEVTGSPVAKEAIDNPAAAAIDCN